MSRLNNRIKQPFWYALYNERTAEYDDYGNETGGYAVTYGKPVKAYGNISAAKGEVVARQFGDDDLYDRTILLENRDTPIDEYAVLWIDETPVLNVDGTLKTKSDGSYVTPWNYIIRKVARGLPKFGCVTLAVDKVTVA